MSNINEHSKVSKVYKALVGYDYVAEDEHSLDPLGVEYDDGSFEVIQFVEITAGNGLNSNHSSRKPHKKNRDYYAPYKKGSLVVNPVQVPS